MSTVGPANKSISQGNCGTHTSASDRAHHEYINIKSETDARQINGDLSDGKGSDKLLAPYHRYHTIVASNNSCQINGNVYDHNVLKLFFGQTQ